MDLHVSGLVKQIHDHFYEDGWGGRGGATVTWTVAFCTMSYHPTPPVLPEFYTTQILLDFNFLQGPALSLA
jgi:hypothetical protein